MIELENIASMALTGDKITTLTKVASKTFKKYNLVSMTGEAEDTYTSNKENGTSMVKQTVKFPINKMSTSVRNELKLLAQNRLVWVVKKARKIKVRGRASGCIQQQSCHSHLVGKHRYCSRRKIES